MLYEYDQEIYRQHQGVLVGVDEAGRGPIAGPVVAAACYIPEGIRIEGVNDSKLLSEKRRCAIYEILCNHPDILFGVSSVSEAEIDSINIYQATLEAMRRALQQLAEQITPSLVLVDGSKVRLGVPWGTRCLVKGDTLSQAIASASIIAKVTRDQFMHALHEKWPQYGFNAHKGYPTVEHKKALARHGPAPCHRRTFAPVKYLGNLS